MPLTLDDVRNVTFRKPPIGKRGYDEEQVNALLVEIENELSRLVEENLRLRSGQPGYGAAGQPSLRDIQDTKGRLERLREERAELERYTETLRVQLEQAAQSRTGTDGGDPGTRVLLMAQQTADQYIEDANQEAKGLLADAHMRATECIEQSRAAATSTLEAAQEQYDAALSALKAERLALQRHLKEKAAFAQHYHSSLQADVEQRVPELGNLLMPEAPRPFLFPG